MIKQHYAGATRRAMNLIWNAAQDYSWNSPFLAFHPNGDPDDYMNMVIGLTAKWLDAERITDFFERLGEGPTLDEASSLLWLGIENCVYGKEVSVRPVLSSLRRQRAGEFFRINGMLSEQQMSFMSIRVYDQEFLRWSRVLGRRATATLPSAKELAGKLEFSPRWDTDEVICAMHRILKDTFRMTLPDHPRQAVRNGPALLGRLAERWFRTGGRGADLLLLRKGSGKGDAKRSVHIAHDFGMAPGRENSGEDRAYIEASFGPCMYTEAEMRILESSLCRENDAACRLWLTRAGGDAGLRQDMEKQKKRNEEYYRRNLFRIRESIRNLSARTDTIFQSWIRYLPVRAKTGRLDGSRVWRPGVLKDNRIFLTDSDPNEISVCVDLVLDASQSRMNAQEMIASQALIIARSFEACHIPVRVTAFRSLRGYTVLQRLKEYGDPYGEGIFHYYAGGWNRDALCLKTLRYLMEEEKKQGNDRTRILLMLTDASPNDSVPLPPRNGGILPREYEGDEPVRDAQEAVRGLQKDGIHTAALFYGASSHLEQVHQIYGQRYERVKTLSQLPEAVCELVRRCLEETA